MRLFAAKDNAIGQLSAAIGINTLNFPLLASQGLKFPVPIKQIATSAGSQTTLNCTGIGASGIAVKDTIENVTDGSYAYVRQVLANQVITTPLIGGTDNIWQISDIVVVDRFMVTLNKKDGDGFITAQEKSIITEISGDNLLLNSVADRGIDGTTPLTFDLNDYVELFVEQNTHESLRIAVAENAIKLAETVESIGTTISLPIAGAEPLVTSGAIISQKETTINKRNYTTAKITANADEGVSFSFSIPKDWDGNQIRLNIIWEGNSTNTGNARFGVKALCTINNQNIDSAFASEQFILDANQGNARSNVSGNLDILPSGVRVGGAWTTINLRRNGSNAADTFTGTVDIIEVALTYNI